MTIDGGKGQRSCHLGSAVRLVKRMNEWVAIPRYIKPSGYKHKQSYGFRPLMASETTSTSFQKRVIHVSDQKSLVPYHPNAPRNRPKQSLTNVVGSRHKLHPCIKHEKYRGSSSVRLVDCDPESLRRWKSTNQVFAECSRVADTVGLANPGISSMIARNLHKKQRVYGGH